MTGEETQFERDLIRLVAHELPQARRDAARAGIMVETLSRALGMTISVVSDGSAEAANRLVDGCEGYIVEEVTRLTPAFGQIFKGLRT